MSLKEINVRKIYTRLAVKSPVLVLAVTIVTFLLLYYFSVTSKVDVFENFDGELKIRNDGSISIEVLADKKYLGKINLDSRAYWYVNRQVALYKAKVSAIENQTKARIEIIPLDKDIEILRKPENAQLKKVMVDIVVGNERLLDRLFKKGASK